MKHLCQQNIHTPEQQRWLPKLLGYNFNIEYKPGKENMAADALSRCFLMQLTTSSCTLQTLIQQLQQKDKNCRDIIQAINSHTITDSNYTWRQNLLWKQGRIVVPDDHQLRQQLLHEYHATPVGGHAGSLRTYIRLAQQFYWKGMRKDTAQFVKTCIVCQQAKSANTHPGGLLQPLPIPQQIWEDISMDFIVGLPLSKGLSVIFVVIDRLSKFGHFMPLKADFTSSKVAEVFIQNVVKLHGVPKTIVSDRDKTFLSQFWRQLFQAMGTTLSMSSAYHPQTDGQTEALNKCLELYLRCFVSEHPKAWVELLPWAQYWYNTSFQCSAALTPFKIVYGRDPPTLIPYYSNDHNPSDVSTLLQQ